MLSIIVPETELWDGVNEEFHYVKEQSLQLEHSLLSLSKWESRWHKPFFSKVEKTDAEVLDYVRCMTLNKNVDPFVYFCLDTDNVKQIKKYIDDPMTATTFSNMPDSQTRRENITSELIYYWMVSWHIPFECEKWHVNRLITLIEVCSVKNTPRKKMGQKELVRYQEAVNEANRKRFHSKG